MLSTEKSSVQLAVRIDTGSVSVNQKRCVRYCKLFKPAFNLISQLKRASWKITGMLSRKDHHKDKESLNGSGSGENSTPVEDGSVLLNSVILQADQHMMTSIIHLNAISALDMLVQLMSK